MRTLGNPPYMKKRLSFLQGCINAMSQQSLELLHYGGGSAVELISVGEIMSEVYAPVGFAGAQGQQNKFAQRLQYILLGPRYKVTLCITFRQISRGGCAWQVKRSLISWPYTLISQ